MVGAAVQPVNDYPIIVNSDFVCWMKYNIINPTTISATIVAPMEPY